MSSSIHNPLRPSALPPRTLLSHAHRPSLDSIASASTADPASSAENEPRISISSTVYPASDDDTDHFHQRPDSFIDLDEPDEPLALSDTDDDPAPVSPILFAPPRMARPQTTNFLDLGDRKDLVRKSRKLTRVFGTTPNAASLTLQAEQVVRTRPAALLASTARRHSMPLSPDDVSFLSITSPPIDRGQFAWESSRPESFMDLSDDETAPSPRSPRRGRLVTQPSLETIASAALTPEALAEDERRRKRERLAKLHRFLGSRVPAHLVLGLDDPALDAILPPIAVSPPSEGDEGTARKAWLRRRRSSSVGALRSPRGEELERVREELDDKEKAINVRRAHKMEKVFGVAPPQTLYHTRCKSPPARGDFDRDATPPATPTASSASASRPATYKKAGKAKRTARPSTAESSRQLLPKGLGDANVPPTPVLPGTAGHAKESHPDGPSYIYSHYQHSLNSLHDILDRDDRASLAELHEYLNNGPPPPPPGTAEGTEPGLDPLDSSTPTTDEFATNASAYARMIKAATVEEDAGATTEGLAYDAGAGAYMQRDRRLSTASSLKSERRRSLPARTSLVSLASLAASEFTISPEPGQDAFQQRRRRAAKLTQFFGVNYRELVADVLESIETGVAQEGKRGTLRAEEVEDLLSKLRMLKTKRTGLF